jgi:hypothetical protein
VSILAVSISHKTTSVEVLSRLAMDGSAAAKLSDAIIASEHVDEVVVLSTCNRTEVYAAVSRFHGALDDVSVVLAPSSPGSIWPSCRGTAASTSTRERSRTRSRSRPASIRLSSGRARSSARSSRR